MITGQTLREALRDARRYAKDGPRIAAIIEEASMRKGRFLAIPGFVAAPKQMANNCTMVYLVTPDGRVWHEKEQK